MQSISIVGMVSDTVDRLTLDKNKHGSNLSYFKFEPLNLGLIFADTI
jgi:hypothetical protein